MELDKQKNQKIKLQLIFAIAIFTILFIISFIIGYLIINKDYSSNDKNNNLIKIQKENKNEEITKNPIAKNVLPPINQEKLESEYKEKITEIINLYEESKIISNTVFWADFSYSTLDKLFNMIVPAEHKEFHLKLVRGFNIINQSANDKNAPHKIGEGFEMVNNAIEKYSKKN